MFVSTGSRMFEGFPNVFLQAAATSVPVVTLDSDPGFISRHNAGAVCNGSLDQFASEIVRLWTNRSQAEELGRNGLRYVTEHHSETATIRRLHEITQVTPSDLFFKTSAADEARL
jgi:glycosyltransferase involved in cell wall biosynthesis